jgi:hypothetical protein
LPSGPSTSIYGANAVRLYARSPRTDPVTSGVGWMRGGTGPPCRETVSLSETKGEPTDTGRRHGNRRRAGRVGQSPRTADEWRPRGTEADSRVLSGRGQCGPPQGAGDAAVVPPAALGRMCGDVGGGGGNRTHVREPSATGVYVGSRFILRLSRSSVLHPAGGPRGQPHLSRPSPEARFRASHQDMMPVPGP